MQVIHIYFTLKSQSLKLQTLYLSENVKVQNNSSGATFYTFCLRLVAFSAFKAHSTKLSEGVRMTTSASMFHQNK